MKCAGYIGYHTRNNLENFDDVAFNPLETGFCFLFSGSVFLFAILLNVNGFS